MLDLNLRRRINSLFLIVDRVIDMHASKMNTDVYELVNTEIFPKLCEQRAWKQWHLSSNEHIMVSDLGFQSHLPIKGNLEAVVYFRS